MNLLHNAQPDLKWIRDTIQLYRRNNNSNNTANCQEKHPADVWYEKFREQEKSLKSTMPDNTSPSVPTTDVGGGTTQNISIHQDTSTKPLQDQSETAKNDLSHEANYKLSKYEQENEEEKRHWLEGQEQNEKKTIKNSISKRTLNPADEIRLKIRDRMEDKYNLYGSYTQFAGVTNQSGELPPYEEYASYQPKFHQIPNYNLFKRDKNTVIDKSTEGNGHVAGDDRTAGDAKTSDDKVRVDDNGGTDDNGGADDNVGADNNGGTGNENKFSNRKLLQFNHDYYDSDGNADADADDDDNYMNEPEILNYDARSRKLGRGRLAMREKRQKRNNYSPGSAVLVNDLVTGILPNKLVKAIFQLIEKNDNFRTHLRPHVNVKGYVEIKKSDIAAQNAQSNTDLSKKTDDMINKIIHSISQLVDEQVKLRTCNPLKPGLQQFLRKLLSIRSKQRIFTTKYDFPVLNHESDSAEIDPFDNAIDHNRYVRSLAILDGAQLNEKYSTLTNLLKSFNQLTTSEQLKYNSIKEFINNHLSLLDELSKLKNESQLHDDFFHQTAKRDTIATGMGARNSDGTVVDEGEHFNRNLNTIEIKQPFNDQMTERFIKLTKMVEFMRQNSLLDTTDYDFIGNDFIL